MEFIRTKEQLKEAFRAGTSEKIMKLLESYIAKRVPFRIDYNMPKGFTTSAGAFRGFYGYVNGGKKVVRINFLLGDSERVHSLDVFADDLGLKKSKTYTFVAELNAVQMAKYMLEIVAGITESVDFNDPKLHAQLVEQLQEKKGRKAVWAEPVVSWLEEFKDQGGLEANLIRIQKDSYKDLLYQFVEDFAAQKREEGEDINALDLLRKDSDVTSISEAQFRKIVQEWMEGNGVEDLRTRGRKKKQHDIEPDSAVEMGSTTTNTPGQSITPTSDPEEDTVGDLDNIDFSDVGYEEEAAEPDNSMILPEQESAMGKFDTATDAFQYYKEIWNNFQTSFISIWKASRMTGKKETKRGMIVFGQGGIGKSVQVEQWIKDMGLKENRDYVYTKATLKGPDLIRFFWEHKDKNLIVFDDADKTWADAGNQQLFKGALDTTGPRIEFRKGQSAKHAKLVNSEGIPEGFDYEKPSVIIITNRDRKSIKDSGIKRRFWYVDIWFTSEQATHRIVDAIDPAEHGATQEQVNQVAAYWISLARDKKVDPDDFNFTTFLDSLRFRIAPETASKWRQAVKGLIFGVGVQTSARGRR